MAGVRRNREDMNIYKSIVIGFFAIFPAVLLTIVSIFQDEIPSIVQGSDFLVAYWWAVILGPCIIVWIAFIGGAFLNTKLSSSKKIIWVAALIILIFYAMPFYWWFCINKAPNKALKFDAQKARAS